MACHLVSRAQVREIVDCSDQQVKLATQQLQAALYKKKKKALCRPFLAPRKEQKGRPKAQSDGEKEREDMISSSKQQECIQGNLSVMLELHNSEK